MAGYMTMLIQIMDLPMWIMVMYSVQDYGWSYPMTRNSINFIGGALGLIKLIAFVYGCFLWGWPFVIVGLLLALTVERA